MTNHVIAKRTTNECVTQYWCHTPRDIQHVSRCQALHLRTKLLQTARCSLQATSVVSSRPEESTEILAPPANAMKLHIIHGH